MKSTTLPVRGTAQTSFRVTSSWWALTLGYYVSCCLMHLQFSLWLVRPRDTVFGRVAYADAMPALVIGGAAALFVWLALHLRTSARPGLTAALWLLWLAAVALIDRYLIFAMNEYAHYPQYALLAWLLARAMDPRRRFWYAGRVLFWATLLGIGDEVLQYTWITTSYSEYLDFNDFVTNLVAAAAGVLLYYGSSAASSEPSRRSKPVLEMGVAIAIAVLVAAALLGGRVVHTPSTRIPPGGFVLEADGSRKFNLQRGPDYYGGWQSGKRHDRYYVLPPLQGSLIMLMLGLAFAGYGMASRRTGRRLELNVAAKAAGELQ